MNQFWKPLKRRWSTIKRWLYPVILLATLIFLGRAFAHHWQEVQTIRIDRRGFASLAIATGLSLLAHIWAGWVWGWVLALLDQPVSGIWSVQAYLKTNIAKYLPSNLVHLYGRTLAATEIGIPLTVASLSVLLDTLLMAAAGLIVALLAVPGNVLIYESLALVLILILVHPKGLNFLLRQSNRWFGKSASLTDANAPPRLVKHYPLRPLLGEIGFVVLRGVGFILTVMALTPLPTPTLVPLLGVFSIGWVLGLVTPGAPGGLGVFEVTVITLLGSADLLAREQPFSPAILLSAVALYRLVSILAEAMGAVLAWLDEKRQPTPSS